MAFDAHVLKVLIASPGDTSDERVAVVESLHGWNAARGEREKVVLLPRRWETDAVPHLGGSGQSVINSQLVDDADIIIALFDSRLGQATDDAVSGTAEEIQRAHTSGKVVHVYFSDEPLPRDVSAEQLTALRSFKTSLEQQGLLGSYANPADLGFQVRNAVEHDLTALDLGAVTARQVEQEHALLRTEYKYEREPRMDSKGRTKMHTTRERLEVTNHGTVTAAGVRMVLEALGAGEPPHLYSTDTEVDIIPRSHCDFPVMMSMGTSSGYKVVLTWREGDEERTEAQSITG